MYSVQICAKGDIKRENTKGVAIRNLKGFRQDAKIWYLFSENSIAINALIRRDTESRCHLPAIHRGQVWISLGSTIQFYRTCLASSSVNLIDELIDESLGIPTITIVLWAVTHRRISIWYVNWMLTELPTMHVKNVTFHKTNYTGFMRNLRVYN